MTRLKEAESRLQDVKGYLWLSRGREQTNHCAIPTILHHILVMRLILCVGHVCVWW